CDHHGDLLVVDTENHAIRRIDAVSGVVTTIAGGHQGGEGDGGPATAAGLDRPHGCDVDEQGNIYIAGSNNHRGRGRGAGGSEHTVYASAVHARCIPMCLSCRSNSALATSTAESFCAP